MTTYEIFVHDDRYSVPTLHLVTMADVAEARLAADALLRASPRHLGVELCRGGVQIMALGDCPDRRPTEAWVEHQRLASGG